MAGNGQQQQSLFTIEQIELLRRLRNSGIQKDQIVAAFESLDRMDRELGPVYTIPVTLAASMAALQGMQQQLSAASVLTPNLAANMARQLAQAQAQAQAQAAQAQLALQQQQVQVQPAPQQVPGQTLQPPSASTPPSSGTATPLTPQGATLTRKRSSETPVDELSGTVSPASTTAHVSMNGTTNNTPMLVGMEEIEESDEFKDFIR